MAVAHTETEEEGGSAGGVLTVFLSLLVPIEPEDELAWLKWPMTIGGVLIFVFFKMFGTMKKPKPNTPGGTFSKYGRLHSRFGGGGEEGGAKDLKQLREKLSEIESS